MKCIIIDDENLAITIVEKFVKDTPKLTLTGKFTSAIEALKFLNENDVNLVFLDIHMPAFTGFDFIKTIKKTVKIIFTTSDKDFALEAFEYEQVVDYLLKPITKERFDKAVGKAFSFVAPSASNTENPEASKQSEKDDDDNAKELYINIDRRLIKIEFKTIDLILAKGDYIQIKTRDKNYTVHSTLKKIEGKLPPSIFMKVHRSYVINLTKIVDIEDNSVLINKDVIPVSRNKRPELFGRLNLL